RVSTLVNRDQASRKVRRVPAQPLPGHATAFTRRLTVAFQHPYTATDQSHRRKEPLKRLHTALSHGAAMIDAMKAPRGDLRTDVRALAPRMVESLHSSTHGVAGGTR